MHYATFVDPTPPPASDWDDIPLIGDANDGAWNEGFLTSKSAGFDEAAADLKRKLEACQAALEGTGASNPKALADFQAALGEYTLYRSAQSKTIEAIASMDKATVNRLA